MFSEGFCIIRALSQIKNILFNYSYLDIQKFSYMTVFN